MDLVSLFIAACVALSSLLAGRHAVDWSRQKWLLSFGYAILSVVVLVIIGLINKRIYLVLILAYVVLLYYLETAVKSRFGHLWFSLFVGMSGVIPMAIYQLFFL